MKKWINNKRNLVFFRKIYRKIMPPPEPGLMNPDLSPIQKKTIVIIRRIIKNPDSVLLVAPISNIFYAEYKHYFVRFSYEAAIITNGKFSYYITLPGKNIDELQKLFNHKVEERRMSIENEYDKTTIANFDEILNSL